MDKKYKEAVEELRVAREDVEALDAELSSTLAELDLKTGYSKQLEQKLEEEKDRYKRIEQAYKKSRAKYDRIVEEIQKKRNVPDLVRDWLKGIFGNKPKQTSVETTK